MDIKEIEETVNSSSFGVGRMNALKMLAVIQELNKENKELTKQLSIAVVGKCYTAQDIDKSYDQGYKDGATEENEHH